MNSGDTSWILVSTALVLFMTLPGLALFYGGLVRSKSVLSVIMQCFSIAAVASLLWLILGYTLAFGNDVNGIVDNLEKTLFAGIKPDTVMGTIPEIVFALFQMTFAIITPALMVGAFVEPINYHGERANRIVHDMLQMGRDSGERRPTNINNLLDEHARLAYHSAKATNADFQLTLEQDLDPEMVELEVIPQDLGRVFLNMVSNSCYATDQKRHVFDKTTTYIPTLWLSTQQGKDTAEIRIKDNSTGIPSEVIDEIFNPFFTTKPTDQSTGLGLYLCNDIVQSHGGTIRVDSESGQYTEMLIELPLVPPGGGFLERAKMKRRRRNCHNFILGIWPVVHHG